MDRGFAPAEELVRLRAREREVESALREVEDEESRLTQELAKVAEQAVYYESLEGDMKRGVRSPTLRGLIRSLRR